MGRGSVMLVSTLLGWAVLGSCAGSSLRSSTEPPPNIVLFLADDLGIGEVGAWGQKELQTPNIDALAAEGVRFTEFRSSAAVCGPARCSLMTGYHNGHCRLDDNDSDYLRTADITLAERLREVGYATGLFGKWGLSWDHQAESWPNAQGFDRFFGYRDQRHAHNFYPEYLISDTDSLRLGNVVPGAGRMGTGRATIRRDYAPDLIADAAFDWLRSNAERPFFLYWATTLPHVNSERIRDPDGGYEVPSLGRYADRTDWPLAKRSYAAQVDRLDGDLGRLRGLLDSLGVADRTIVIFLSDNGATFLRIADDGTSDIAGRWFDGTADYRGFKGDLYDGGLRVPAIVHWPGVTKANGERGVAVDFTDLHATLLAVAGAAPTPGIDGRSFLASLRGQGPTEVHPHQVWYSPDRRQSAVLAGSWKAVWVRDSMQLFDLATDPGERNDVRSAHPDIARRLDAIRVAEDGRQ
jgi:arylsulfatase A-like enzyme